LAKILYFTSETTLSQYTEILTKPYRKLKNRLIIIEFHEYFCEKDNPKNIDRMLDRMARWYNDYGEENA
jgi:hypothetical protein